MVKSEAAERKTSFNLEALANFQGQQRETGYNLY